MAGLLEAASWALPLTYGYDALQQATDPASLGARLGADLAAVAAATLAALALGALTLHRRTA
jgi:ABC-2 type transport system permease protein